MEAPPLVAENLGKRYGDKRVVDDVSFEVPRGSLFCLLGANGAGKTTTLSISQGLRKPTEGQVRVFGHDPRALPREARRRMGVLPQRFTCFPTLTVRENIEYFADIYDARPDVRALLDGLGLLEHERALYGTLSGGTMRRVAIATALVNDPELLFLDEPTAGVDPANRRKLWQILERLRAEGRAIVLTTHYMDEAERLADEVAIMHRGRVVARGKPDEVRRMHGGGTVLRVSGVSEPWPPLLAQRGAFAPDGSGDILVPLESASEASLLVAELVKSGATYREISVREPSLDDAFVRLAGGETE